MNSTVSSGAADELQRSRDGAEHDAWVAEPVACGQGAGSGERADRPPIVALILKSFPLNDLSPYRPTTLPPCRLTARLGEMRMGTAGERGAEGI